MELKTNLIFSLFHFCLEAKVEQKFKPDSYRAKYQPSLDFFAHARASTANQLRVRTILADAYAPGKHLIFGGFSKTFCYVALTIIERARFNFFI